MHIQPKGHNLCRATPGEFLGFILVYCRLLAARLKAQLEGLPAQALAVPLSPLREEGVPDQVFLWMLYQAHVEHFRPADGSNEGIAAAIPTGSVLLTSDSSFALTEAGELFAGSFLYDVLVPEGNCAGACSTLLLGLFTPSFDKNDRIFRWGGHVLKCFRQPSVNQEMILRTAEEVSWANWFDDPLPYLPPKRAKQRLHDTIKNLNRNQASHLIHFKGDGTGTRIGWEYK